MTTMHHYRLTNLKFRGTGDAIVESNGAKKKLVAYMVNSRTRLNETQVIAAARKLLREEVGEELIDAQIDTSKTLGAELFASILDDWGKGGGTVTFYARATNVPEKVNFTGCVYDPVEDKVTLQISGMNTSIYNATEVARTAHLDDVAGTMTVDSCKLCIGRGMTRQNGFICCR